MTSNAAAWGTNVVSPSSPVASAETYQVPVVLLVLPDHGSMLVAAVVLGALANSLITGMCAQALSRGDSAN
ncbi:hypothetical protein PV963_21025 [Streptomyces coeruleorubidus]|uniref:hypothetical protein n=1 Tax=Streptomyces coeruleorubidus TaxID=116188 RepID=UPI00237FD21B|nr:hypothetical protein [Streptomyces coeruleorubidus]WDV52682.1 hypothetical protein PV963_21025 [Streptomyces coeruleorubidus]